MQKYFLEMTTRTVHTRKLCGTNVYKLLRNFEMFSGEFNVYLKVYLKLKFIFFFQSNISIRSILKSVVVIICYSHLGLLGPWTLSFVWGKKGLANCYS